MLLWSFFLGLFADLFSNTPGLGAASLTLMAFVQPYLLDLFIPREAPENMRSAVATMGFGKFATFAFTLVFAYCVVFFTLEAFTFFNWIEWVLTIIGSTVLTLALVLTLETIRK
jgi:rod shape-determining protein MreD